MRTVAKTAMLPLIVAIACSVTFFILSVLATFADKSALRTHVSSAFAASKYGGARNIQDCMLLYELVAPYEARWEEALFPKLKNVPEPLCDDIEELLAGEQHSWQRYTRYLHGQRSLAGILLGQLEVRAAQDFLLVGNYLLLACAAGALLWRRWRNRDTELTPAFTFGLVLLICLSAFYVTFRHGSSLAFGPADCTLYLLLLVALSLNLSRVSIHGVVALASFFGGTIAYVDWNSGHGSLALASLLALVAASASNGDRPSALVQRGLWVIFAFATAFIGMFVIKIVAVSVLPLGQDPNPIFVSQMLYQMGGPVPPESQMSIRFGIDITQHAMYSWHALLYAAIELGYASQTLCRDNLWAGLSLLFAAALGLLAGGVSRWHRLPNGIERARTAVFVAAAAVVPAWYLLFLHATIIGAAQYVIRPLVVSIAIGLWLGASELAAAVPNIGARGNRRAVVGGHPRSDRAALLAKD